jgi:SAM-dependent methyltransferase
MNLQNSLRQNKSFYLESGIFYQVGLQRPNIFENLYIELREKEDRLYNDETLSSLPQVRPSHHLAKEWRARSASLQKLLPFLKGGKYILEIGCGNGWLSSKIATSINAQVVAMDITEVELVQAARVFQNVPNLQFVYGDIFSVDFSPVRFDRIILASSIQYFPDLPTLIKRLIEVLDPAGQILIIDSPFYRSADAVSNARNRSEQHFRKLGFPQMTECYFHHLQSDLEVFKPEILFNPSSPGAHMQRKLLGKKLPAFPFIRIVQK